MCVWLVRMCNWPVGSRGGRRKVVCTVPGMQRSREAHSNCWANTLPLPACIAATRCPPCPAPQVAVVLPLASVVPQVQPASEALLALLFGVTTLATTLNINGAELFNAALLTVGWDPEAVQGAVPGTLAFLSILGEIVSILRILSVGFA